MFLQLGSRERACVSLRLSLCSVLSVRTAFWKKTLLFMFVSFLTISIYLSPTAASQPAGSSWIESYPWFLFFSLSLGLFISSYIFYFRKKKIGLIFFLPSSWFRRVRCQSKKEARSSNLDSVVKKKKRRVDWTKHSPKFDRVNFCTCPVKRVGTN